MKSLFTSIILFFSLLMGHWSYAQSLEIRLDGQKDCSSETYCVDLLLQAASNSSAEIGNASILLEYNSKALSFASYAAANFDAANACSNAQANTWAHHRFDVSSKEDVFHLVLLFEDGTESCQQISENVPTAIGTLCFDIVQQGANPIVNIDLEHTYFNNNQPNNGNNQLNIASAESIDNTGLLACDCQGEGQACDDQNVYTVNDQFDINCECKGILLDSDEDGVLDGIDACLDQVYEAEDASITNALIRTNYPQYSGLAYVDYQTNNSDIIEFTVQTEQEGLHQLSFRYASFSNNRRVELSIDGTIVEPQFDFPNTESWSNWQDVGLNYFFTVGTHTIRLATINRHGPNLDKLTFSYCTDCNMSGQPCDDGNLCTTDDVYDANCNCAGRYEDDDNDGICNVQDMCPGGADDLDEDSDGLPDHCDDCNDNLIGQACDDGNPCSVGDTYDANCNCVGITDIMDSDNDGVCDIYDICPDGDDSIDEDADGIPDACDICNDLTVGRPCDDGNPCTILDVVQADCGCVGIPMDNDNDGVCNWDDICEGADDNIDVDGDGVPDACDPNVGDITTIRIETGVVPFVGEDWQVVELRHDYNSMVVIATVHLNSYEQVPVVSRIRNAEGNSFELRIQNPGGNTADVYSVYYTVVEEGVYREEFDGVSMEAKKVTSALTAEDNNWYGTRQEIGYSQIYTNPVVVGQVMTHNDPRWSVFMATGNSSGNEPDTDHLFITKHVGEDTDIERVNETLGYLVLEAGVHELGGTLFEAGMTLDTIGGVSEYASFPGYKQDIALDHANGALLSITGMDGGNGGWPVLYGQQFIKDGELILVFDEDQINDSERAHTFEEVAYLAFYDEDHCQLDANIAVSDVNCFEGTDGTSTVEIASAVGYPTATWSNGADNLINENLSAGIYGLTLVDANGCEWIGQTTIEEPNPLNTTYQIVNNVCFGAAEGQIILQTEGGTGPYNYAWETGVEGDIVNDLLAASYTVSIYDANGCKEIVENIEVSEPAEMEVAYTQTPADNSDGSVQVTASGGTPPYTFEWSTGETTAALSNLEADIYDLTITDAAGCQQLESIEIYRTPKMESHLLPAVSEAWQTIYLTNHYDNMVVVATVQMPLEGSLNMEPVVARIQNTTNNSLELRIQNPGGTTDKSYPVHLLVVEAGVYTEALHGITMEAVHVESTKTAYTADWTLEERTYQNSYTNPIVLGQVMTFNTPLWSMFWASKHNSKSAAPDASGFAAGKHVGADWDNPARLNEKLGLIIVEGGVYNFSKYTLEAGRTPDNIQGIQNTSTGYPVALNLTEVDHAVLSVAGMDGGDGGWPVLYGLQPFATPNNMNIAFDEDQLSDTERWHTTEEVAFLAIDIHNTDAYCMPIITSDNTEWIDVVALNGVLNQSSNDGGYGDYSDQVTIYTQGTIENILVVPSFSGDASTAPVKAYIDFNQDYDFVDDGEEVLNQAVNSNFVMGSFQIPDDATLGLTRMRLVFGNLNDNACGVLSNGEVEDYSIDIQAPAALQIAGANNQTVVGERFKASLNVYPNPVSHELQVNILLPEKQFAEIRVTNLNGQQMQQFSNDLEERTEWQLNVENWPDGIYFIQMKLADEILTKRFVKARK